MSVHGGYGWKPGLPDVRNYKLAFHGQEIAPSVDLRTTGLLPDIWDQGQIGSCTAHGSGAAYSFDLAKQGVEKNFTPSRLFVYYNAREIEGTTLEDSGATITDAIKSLNRYGCPIEDDWLYDVSKFAVRPPSKAYSDGVLREAVKYAQVAPTITEMKACLTTGTPIVIGFSVYDSFESQAVADTGDVPLPSTSEQLLGGHCVLVVGYTVRNGKNVWICRNSWGTGWGDNGYFYMPEAYLTNRNLAEDFWTVQSVSSPSPTPIPPKPQPTPTPTPDADHLLWTNIKTWANGHHYGVTRKAANSVKEWAKAKGLT